MAWNQGGTGAGDGSVEAADLGGGLQEGTSDCGRSRWVATEILPLQVHGVAHLDGQAEGNAWAGRPVACAGAMIQRYLEGWQLRPPGRYLWEALPLQGLRQLPDPLKMPNLIYPQNFIYSTNVI